VEIAEQGTRMFVDEEVHVLQAVKMEVPALTDEQSWDRFRNIPQLAWLEIPGGMFLNRGIQAFERTLHPPQLHQMFEIRATAGIVSLRSIEQSQTHYESQAQR
jgi:hypothetical protein